jgi:hypothetical protein
MEVKMENHYTVYKLTDPEGKVYIGCTGKPVEKRWKKGWNYNAKSRIYKAIRLFGWENFEKKILCEKLTREGAEKLEKWFIAYYDSANPEKGYNRALGGLGKGVRVCEATRLLNREKAYLVYKEHPEVKEKIRASVTRLLENDPTYRERVSKAKRAIYENPEFVRSCSMFQKKYYEEHPERKEEISRQMKEYLSKPENRRFLECDRRPKPVICVETGVYYPSQKAAEKATGYSGIHCACKGKRSTSGGYHWRYA